MLAYTYISPSKFELIDKPKPELQSPRDAIVHITLGSICTSDLHIKHGSVQRALCTARRKCAVGFVDNRGDCAMAMLHNPLCFFGKCMG